MRRDAMLRDFFCPACGHGLRFVTRMAWLRLLASAAQHGDAELRHRSPRDALHFACSNCAAEFVMPRDTELATA